MRLFRRRKKSRSAPRAARTMRRRRRWRVRLPDEGDRRWMKVTRLGMTFMILGGLLLVYIARTLPDIHKLESVKKEQAITVETADGRVIATYGDVYGAYIPYEKLPKHLIQAVIATEDRRFFVHHGVDFLGIARAMIANIAEGRVVQGGSTITQQVAKNVFLTPRRSIERKLQEVLIAFWLEGRYTKQEILAIYLNRVYLGGGTYGVDAAAKRYFNKPATQLTLVESAMLAGLLKAPSHFAPTSNIERAKERAAVILGKMVDAGMIKGREAKAALAAFKKEELPTVEGNAVRYFTDWVVDDLQNYIGTVEDDLVVTTTLDPKLEEYAKDAVENIVATDGPAKKVTQGALVAMEPDGAVRAMIGGVSYSKSQYNRATQAKRQPGSVFKLFVYLAALEAGYTPLTTVVDEPVEVQVGQRVWSPDNFSVGEYKGEIPMVQALRESLNTVSVRLSHYAGLDRVANMAMRLGIPDVPAYSSIGLGTVETTLLELTGAYAHLANRGNKLKPYGILAVKTTDGKEIYKREEQGVEPVLASGTVEMMNYMLLNVVQAGTGTRAAIDRPVAGKTGTSSDYKDAWFIGFTPQLVAGVWVGNDNNTKMKHVTGGNIPAAIWRDFMVKAMQDKKVAYIPNSEGSHEGLLPWLFGGASSEPPPPLPEGVVLEERPVTAPPEDASASGLPWQRAEQPASGKKSDDVLTPGFWDKLMKQAPKLNKQRVEYEYPGDRPRR